MWLANLSYQDDWGVPSASQAPAIAERGSKADRRNLHRGLNLHFSPNK